MAKSDSKPFPSLFVLNESGAEVEYKLVPVPDARKAHVEYRHGQDSLPSAPPKLIVEENGEKSVFEPDRDAKGYFKRESGQPLLYRDKKGRVLTEGPMFERKTGFPFGRFLFGVLLNLMFPAVWFVCLWLLLRYQLWHAIGLAVVMSVVMMLFIVQPIMSRAEAVARPQVEVTTNQ